MYKPLTEFTYSGAPSKDIQMRSGLDPYRSYSSPSHRRIYHQEARIKNKGYLKFRLLENVHSVSINDIALLRTCYGSRDVFLSIFRHHLQVGKGGLIRYADEDVIYIAKSSILSSHVPSHGS